MTPKPVQTFIFFHFRGFDLRPKKSRKKAVFPRVLPIKKGGLPAEGLDTTRPCGHWILSPARLPIPPRRLSKRSIYGGNLFGKNVKFGKPIIKQSNASDHL